MNRLGAVAHPQPWTESEIATLRAVYQHGGSHAAVAALPHRSRPSIFQKAIRLGLRNKRSKWTAGDHARLRRLWNADLTLEAIATALGSTPIGVIGVAKRLGLPAVPEGFEYLTHAAKRTGVDVHQLRRILHACHVWVRPTLSRPPPKGVTPSHKRLMVWPAEVDDAIAEWFARETLQSAGERLGMTDASLKRRLAAAGVGKRRRARNARWRLSAADLEKALRFRALNGRSAGVATAAGA